MALMVLPVRVTVLIAIVEVITVTTSYGVKYDAHVLEALLAMKHVQNFQAVFRCYAMTDHKQSGVGVRCNGLRVGNDTNWGGVDDHVPELLAQFANQLFQVRAAQQF